MNPEPSEGAKRIHSSFPQGTLSWRQQRKFQRDFKAEGYKPQNHTLKEEIVTLTGEIREVDESSEEEEQGHQMLP